MVSKCQELLDLVKDAILCAEILYYIVPIHHQNVWLNKIQRSLLSIKSFNYFQIDRPSHFSNLVLQSKLFNLKQ